MAAQELTFKISATDSALKATLSSVKAAYSSHLVDVTKMTKAEAQAAIALQRQRSAALVAEWKNETRAAEREQKAQAQAAISLQKQRSAALIAQWRADERERTRIEQEGQRSRSAFISGAVGGLTALVGVSAISEIRAAGAAMIDYASKLETTKIAFTQMMGSADLAGQHLKDLQQFALKTPFQFGELIDASQRMQALGFNAQQVIPILTDVGNAVAAAGGGSERLDRVVLALSQIQSKGKVATQELNQLAEAGISGWKILEAQLGKSRAELVKMVEAGQISSAVFLEAFQKFSKQNFGGLMEQQSKTFSGAMSNIKDALLQTSAVAFEPLYKKLSQTAQQLGDLAINSQKFRDDMKQVGGVLVTIWDGATEAFYILRDAVRLGAAAIVGQMTAMSAVIMAVSDSFIAAYRSAQALGFFMMGDFKSASNAARQSQEALQRVANDVKIAIDAEGSVVRALGQSWTEAGARSLLAAQQMREAALAGNASIGTNFLARAYSAAQSALPPPPTGGSGASKKGGGGAREKVSAAQQLINQLTEEYNRLEAKANDLTKVDIVTKELLEPKYKKITAAQREQIESLATWITMDQEKIAQEKKDTEAAKDRTKTYLEAAKQIREAMHKNFEERTAIEGKLTDEIQSERDALSELEFGKKSHVQIAEEFVAKTIAEAEAVGGVTEKMRQYFAVLIQLAAKEDEIIAKAAELEAALKAPSDAISRAKKDTGEATDFGGNAAAAAHDAHIAQMKEQLSTVELLRGSYENLASSISSGIGTIIQDFVLMGTVGPGAFKKILASALATVAAQAGAQAIYELALGFAALTPWGAAIYGPAVMHFKAAALLGSIALVTGVAGRVMAGNSFQSATGGGGGAASSAFQSATSPPKAALKPQDINRRNVGGSTATQQSGKDVVEIRFTGKLGDVIEAHWIERYKGGGSLRNLVLSDASSS